MNRLFLGLLAFLTVVQAPATAAPAPGATPVPQAVPVPKEAPEPGACAQTIYVATSDGKSSGLVISTNGGLSWEARNPAPGSPAIYSIYALGQNVFVGAYTGLASSRNGGRIWSFHTADPTYSVIPSVSAAPGRAFAAAFTCPNPGAGLDCARVLYSYDNGVNWPVNAVLPNQLAQGRPSAVLATSSRLFVGVNDREFGGLAYTNYEGGTWRVVDAAHGLSSNEVTGIAGFNDYVFVGLNVKSGTIAISEDRGASWGTQNTLPLSQSYGVTSIYANSGYVYVGTNGGGLAISSNWWSSWRVVTSYPNGPISNTINAIGAVGNTVVVGTPSGLSISNDGGSTWTSKTTAQGLPHNNVTAVFVQCQ